MSKKIYLIILLIVASLHYVQAQSFTDGLMMPKKEICVGFNFGQEKFSKYWEGTLLRQSPMGNHTLNNTNFFANYGLIKNLNALVNVAYNSNSADNTTIEGFQGLQDITLGLKYRIPVVKNLRAVFILGGSLPLTNYVAAYPFAIGNQCKTAFGKLMLYYHQPNGLSASVQTGYTLRSNITIDASNYYTDRVVNSNQVEISDAAQYQLRAGYTTYRFDVEAVAQVFQTLGGFDMRRQDLPFPSNKIESTRVGVFSYYRIKSLYDVQVIGSIMYAVNGRNSGQSVSYSLGLFKAFDFSPKKETEILSTIN